MLMRHLPFTGLKKVQMQTMMSLKIHLATCMKMGLVAPKIIKKLQSGMRKVLGKEMFGTIR